MPGDEELALAVQKGQQDSLVRLVERHHSLLLGFLYRMTGGNRALAEDLVQETFLRLLRTIPQYQYPRPFKPWLYTIATNLARDHFKRAEVRQTLALTDDNLEIVEVELAKDLLTRDEAQEVAAALLALPQTQRETIILRYYQELSLAEIATVLNIPLGTVKSRLSLGLHKLREVLEGANNARQI